MSKYCTSLPLPSGGQSNYVPWNYVSSESDFVTRRFELLCPGLNLKESSITFNPYSEEIYVHGVIRKIHEGWNCASKKFGFQPKDFYNQINLPKGYTVVEAIYATGILFIMIRPRKSEENKDFEKINIDIQSKA